MVEKRLQAWAQNLYARTCASIASCSQWKKSARQAPAQLQHNKRKTNAQNKVTPSCPKGRQLWKHVRTHRFWSPPAAHCFSSTSTMRACTLRVKTRQHQGFTTTHASYLCSGGRGTLRTRVPSAGASSSSWGDRRKGASTRHGPITQPTLLGTAPLVLPPQGPRPSALGLMARRHQSERTGLVEAFTTLCCVQRHTPARASPGRTVVHPRQHSHDAHCEMSRCWKKKTSQASAPSLSRLYIADILFPACQLPRQVPRASHRVPGAGATRARRYPRRYGATSRPRASDRDQVLHLLATLGARVCARAPWCRRPGPWPTVSAWKGASHLASHTPAECSPKRTGLLLCKCR